MAAGKRLQMLSNNADTDLTDAAIIVASQRDPALFAQIFDRHWIRVHRYCVSRAGAAGEDIAAETFRVALDSRRRFDRSRVDAGPWLFGIATNLLRHRLRSETRRVRALARLHLHDEADLADGALDRIEAEALGPEVAAALAQLSPKYRDALLLHVFPDGHNYLERIWLDAATGVPIQEKDGDNSATAYTVERVTAAHLPAGISPTARLR